MFLPWSSSDSKSPQFIRTLLSIQPNVSSAVIWMVSILFCIFSSPILFSMFLALFQGLSLFLISFLFSSNQDQVIQFNQKIPREFYKFQNRFWFVYISIATMNDKSNMSAVAYLWKTSPMASTGIVPLSI